MDNFDHRTVQITEGAKNVRGKRGLHICKLIYNNDKVTHTSMILSAKVLTKSWGWGVDINFI